MKRLLAFRSLAHDPQSILTVVHRLALVGIEPLLNVEIRIFKAFSRKLDVAAFADAQHWNAFGAFHYSELATGHDSPSLTHSGGIGFLVPSYRLDFDFNVAGTAVEPSCFWSNSTNETYQDKAFDGSAFSVGIQPAGRRGPPAIGQMREPNQATSCP